MDSNVPSEVTAPSKDFAAAFAAEFSLAVNDMNVKVVLLGQLHGTRCSVVAAVHSKWNLSKGIKINLVPNARSSEVGLDDAFEWPCVGLSGYSRVQIWKSQKWNEHRSNRIDQGPAIRTRSGRSHSG